MSSAAPAQAEGSELTRELAAFDATNAANTSRFSNLRVDTAAAAAPPEPTREAMVNHLSLYCYTKELRTAMEMRLVRKLFPVGATHLIPTAEKDAAIASTGFGNTPVVAQINWTYALFKHIEVLKALTNGFVDMRAPFTEGKALSWDYQRSGALDRRGMIRAITAVEWLGLEPLVHNEQLREFLVEFRNYVKGHVAPKCPSGNLSLLRDVDSDVRRKISRQECALLVGVMLTMMALMLNVLAGAMIYTNEKDDPNPGKIVGGAIGTLAGDAVAMFMLKKLVQCISPDGPELMERKEMLDRLRYVFCAGAEEYEDSRMSAHSSFAVFNRLWTLLQDFEAAAERAGCPLPAFVPPATPSAPVIVVHRSPFAATHAAASSSATATDSGIEMVVNPLAAYTPGAVAATAAAAVQDWAPGGR